ncbi:hypothetical protein GPALN_014503 [Globodera pallida]|uniref:ML domain-containing protein n=1 Tax=Globodera pallida TaxID=36090 RepID=A0A183BNV7_GLOPA|nr:hypothetical protein GPALN_005973 [Globodera pallida]KAI3420881.1 hypothetical protein GPALN_014503 [Globodera pallida]
MIFWHNKFICLIILAGSASEFLAEDAASDQQTFYPIRYKNCKSQFEVLSVAITTNCSSTDRCHFSRGSVLAIQIVFKPNRRVESLQTAVWAHLGDARGALARFHIDNENACADSNITCPVEPGQTYWYTQPVRILAEYPTAEVQVNWLLTSPTALASDSDGGTAERGQPPRAREICVKMLAKLMGKSGTETK